MLAIGLDDNSESLGSHVVFATEAGQRKKVSK